MKRTRSKRQHSLAFDALEGRVALSSGIGTPLAAPRFAAVMMSQLRKTVQASFKGRVQFPSASDVAVTSLSGKIGKDHFTGFGNGGLAGTLFLGGDVYLSNGQGTVHLRLGPAITIRAGKHPRQKVSVVVADSSGKYASIAGSSGTLTTWNVPARQNAVASFGGTLKT
jgi:hypothetical protein